ncbi:MAG: UDP-3-O-(3-hydroxymyristoyl)glucosamine N-acyltransferase [Deltaproteobacteria bacterium]|nr:UDP-3-O-(3-hydroxymyristoyl)glucosamine N-acyltransferase [Deltaproteobacteria bacterium]
MRLGELARRLDLALEGDGDIEITGIAPIDEAGPGDLSFVANPKYRRQLASTGAAAVILGPREDASGKPALRAADPYVALVAALGLLDRRPRPPVGIHPSAVIAASAQVGEGASIGAYAVVGEGVAIGRGCVLHPHVVIYPGVRIGERFIAHAGAVVRESVVIGDDVVLQPGAVVGADGFGFLPRGREVPLPIPQVGSVSLGDCVEIGANATVDRATIGQTRLGRGVKLDNLVMVGHGSRIGAGSMLAGQTGMAGSTHIGERVMAGGQAGFAGHLSVGDDARIAAQAGVIGNVEAGATVAGMPAVDLALWRRAAVALLRLPDLLRRVRRLETLANSAKPPLDR